jgi:hypothetical protein
MERWFASNYNPYNPISSQRRHLDTQRHHLGRKVIGDITASALTENTQT